MIRIFTSKKQVLGQSGEKEAVRFLKKEGFSIIGRNIANKFGEIDIVARKKGVTYFFEVKTGKEGSSISPAENLTKQKLRKFFISVQHYCLVHEVNNCRMQGILILQKPEGTYTVETIELS
ncbi:MAG TPA: YraN family protein [Candidatus Paceibacterota bacterium]|nr:YraN family protein [Candidatus Paceibacterota bacterium]